MSASVIACGCIGAAAVVLAVQRTPTRPAVRLAAAGIAATIAARLAWLHALPESGPVSWWFVMAVTVATNAVAVGDYVGFGRGRWWGRRSGETPRLWRRAAIP